MAKLVSSLKVRKGSDFISSIHLNMIYEKRKIIRGNLKIPCKNKK